MKQRTTKQLRRDYKKKQRRKEIAKKHLLAFGRK